MNPHEMLLNAARRYRFGTYDRNRFTLQRMGRFVNNYEHNLRALIQYVLPIQRNANPYSGEYVFRVRHHNVIAVNNLFQLERDMRNFIGNMIRHVRYREDLRSTDFIQLVVKDDNRTIGTHLVNVSYNIEDEMFRLIEKSLNSNDARDLYYSEWIVIYAKRQRGGGHIRNQSLATYAGTKVEWLKSKRSIIPVQVSKEEDCFFQCVAIHKHYHECVRSNSRIRLKKRIQYAGEIREFVEYEHGQPVSFGDLKHVCTRLNLNVFILDIYTLEIIFKVDGLTSEDSMWILFDYDNKDRRNGHFHYIVKDKLGALLKQGKKCSVCSKVRIECGHNCKKSCIGCNSIECKGADTSVLVFREFCVRCNRRVYDLNCMRTHLKVCENLIRCIRCDEIYNEKESHVCGLCICKSCKKRYNYSEIHECYIGKEETSKITYAYAFYDFECMFDDQNNHVVFGIAFKFEEGECLWFNSVRDMLNELKNWKKGKKGKVMLNVIAHNGGRYDMNFIKKELISNGELGYIASEDLVNGNTLLSITIRSLKIRFLDSYKFIPISLRAIPKAFGFEDVMKGFFPYRFFTVENKEYEGVMPGIEWFDVDDMDEHTRKECMDWHKENEQQTIALDNMCKEYCKNDVLVLEKGCIEYRDLFKKVTNNELDPFSCLTIASVCMKVYKLMYIPDHTIGIFRNEYTITVPGRNWLEECGVEYIPKGLMYDGMRINALYNHTIYIFVDCIDVGCKVCFQRWTKHPTKHRYMWQLENDFKQWCDRQEIAIQIRYQHEDPLDRGEEISIRDAFFGGRTEVYQMVANAAKLRIDYYDFISLYPSVLFGLGVNGEEFKYPTGHPTVITSGPFDELSSYFGFVKCDVTPPKDLLYPVLGEHTNGKLVFDLKPKTGTWTTIELMKAVEVGYKVERIHAVIHFQESSSTLFREYIASFFKLKVIATGWKALGFQTTLEKQQYLDEIQSLFNIKIELDEMKDEKNKGLYTISKLCLNSLWGKFAQRDAYNNTTDVFNEMEFFKIVDEDATEVVNVFMYDNTVRGITYRPKKEFIEQNRNTNLAIAAYTTAYGRLKLYGVLEKVKEGGCYVDTDSIVFKNDGHTLKLGSHMGELSDELGGRYIEQFVSTGPKSYAYELNDGESVVKVKGFTLNYSARQIIHMDSMKELISDRDRSVVTKPLQFIIDKSHSISTKRWRDNEGKTFKATDSKRRHKLLPNGEMASKPWS